MVEYKGGATFKDWLIVVGGLNIVDDEVELLEFRELMQYVFDQIEYFPLPFSYC